MADIRIKTAEQVMAIEETQRAVETAMAKVIEYIRTEKEPTSEVSRELIEQTLLGMGYESPEGSIVAGGRQGAAPHEEGSGVLRMGEPIVIDIYPCSKKTGYFADMSRTVCLGVPPERLQKMYDAVLAAQELAIKMVKPGVHCLDIQNAVESYFIKEGFVTGGEGDKKEGFPFAEGFVHGVGHGVGLEIHQSPRIGRGSEDVLQEGNVITIEPGLYYKDIGGVRIEDMVLVTENGCRNLTHFNKQFIL